MGYSTEEAEGMSDRNYREKYRKAEEGADGILRRVSSALSGLADTPYTAVVLTAAAIIVVIVVLALL